MASYLNRDEFCTVDSNLVPLVGFGDIDFYDTLMGFPEKLLAESTSGSAPVATQSASGSAPVAAESVSVSATVATESVSVEPIRNFDTFGIGPTFDIDGSVSVGEAISRFNIKLVEFECKEPDEEEFIRNAAENATRMSKGRDFPEFKKSRLKKVIRKLEKKLCVCWDIESNEYRENLRYAKEKKKKIILRKIRQNVSERVYLTELIKKCAKGQSIAVRLSKQISRVVLQINGDLKEYNNIQFESADIPQSLSFNEVKSLESVIWQVLESPVSESVVPSSLRQQLVHLKASIDRSVEEQHMLKAEMMSVFSWHKSQHEILIKEVEESDLGLKCLLIREGLYLEKKWSG